MTKILVVCHKFDPDIQNEELMLQNFEDVKAKFDPVIKDTNFDVLFRTTSIFDRQSIEEMFSEGFRKISSVSAIIEKILITYYQTTSARAITLIDSSGIIMGHYSESENDDEIVAKPH